MDNCTLASLEGGVLPLLLLPQFATTSFINLPPVWLVAPFFLLLLAIALGPLLFHRFWERNYPAIATIAGIIVTIYYALFIEHGYQELWHTLEEYFSFIVLIGSLFVASGGILVTIDRKSTPLLNGGLLLFGAIIANLIGTTGASMLLIRPYLRMNEGRIRPFHIVFFIILVSNIGGGLTPIGDPPLFLGFLKGVPFFWVIEHLWLPWIIAISVLLALFIFFDSRIEKKHHIDEIKSGKITIQGRRNMIILVCMIIVVFLDPAIISWVPDIRHILHVPFGLREVILLVLAVISYLFANKEALKGNEFSFEPVREVGFLFLGIFFTMIPALQLSSYYAATYAASLGVSHFYWFTGILSGVLDNAPTYLNFLAGAMGKFGVEISSATDVKHFAEGIQSPIVGDMPSHLYLMAIAMAAVFFGAMTYIGNAPNFMVKNIAAQTGVETPDFIEYLFKYSLPILLPLFVILWLLFFHY